MEILIILCLLCLFFSFRFYRKAKKIKVEKTKEQEQLEYEIQFRNEQLDEAKKKQKQLENEYQKVQDSIFELEKAKEQKTHSLQLEYEKEKENIDTQIQNLQTKLKQIQSVLNAAVEAQLREREKREKINFYKLSLSDLDKEDILKLESVKFTLHQPVILSKLIWTTYFQKQTNDLCNRILGTDKITGIYKITNIETEQCYIGQSLDISSRLKQHIKAGLGIDASATNKLYNAMQKDGVWNFTFELLEQCPSEELDQKERQWIELYHADTVGYNATRGNK